MMRKNINSENEWAKALRKGDVEFDKETPVVKKALKIYQMSANQRRAVRRDNGRK